MRGEDYWSIFIKRIFHPLANGEHKRLIIGLHFAIYAQADERLFEAHISNSKLLITIQQLQMHSGAHFPLSD